MINCILVDSDKKSREVIEGLVRKISGLRLINKYAALETATNTCKENTIQILFIRLYLFPLPKKRIDLLKKIANGGTQIIALSTRIGLAGEAFDLNTADFIMLPTSSTRIWKAVVKALKISEPDIDTAKIKKSEADGKRILLTK